MLSLWNILLPLTVNYLTLRRKLSTNKNEVGKYYLDNVKRNLILEFLSVYRLVSSYTLYRPYVLRKVEIEQY